MKLHEPVTGGPLLGRTGDQRSGSGQAVLHEAVRLASRDGLPAAGEGGYTIARLGDAAVAALTPAQPAQPVAWNVSFAVRDADDVRQVTAAGRARSRRGPTDVFDSGRFVVAADPTGAVFQLWEHAPSRGARLFNAPGSLG